MTQNNVHGQVVYSFYIYSAYNKELIESTESVTVIAFMKNRKMLLKGYQNGKVETLDGSFLFRPFNEHLDALAIDKFEQNIAIANSLGNIKVYSIDYLFAFDHEPFAQFSNHSGCVNQIVFRYVM